MKPVWLLMSAIGIVGANSLALSPIAGEVAASFDGRSAPDVMLASAIFGFGTAFSALVLAPRADQFGLRRGLIWSMIGLATALGLSALAPALWVLISAQALAGMATGLALPSTYGLAAEIAQKGRESETIGKVLTGWTISLVIGVSLSAILADILHWRAVFGVMSSLTLLLLLALLRASLPRGKRGQRITPLAALRIPGLPPILLAVICFMMAFYGLYSFLGTHLTRDIGFSTTLAGIAALSYGIGFGIVAPLDKLIDNYGARTAAPIVFGLLLCVYLCLMAAAPYGIVLLILCFIWGAVNHVGLTLMVGQLTALSPEQRATILGLYSAVTYIAMFIGTSGFKLIFEAYGFYGTALTSAICIAPALLSSMQRSLRDL